MGRRRVPVGERGGGNTSNRGGLPSSAGVTDEDEAEVTLSTRASNAKNQASLLFVAHAHEADLGSSGGPPSEVVPSHRTIELDVTAHASSMLAAEMSRRARHRESACANRTRRRYTCWGSANRLPRLVGMAASFPSADSGADVRVGRPAPRAPHARRSSRKRGGGAARTTLPGQGRWRCARSSLRGPSGVQHCSIARDPYVVAGASPDSVQVGFLRRPSAVVEGVDSFVQLVPSQ